MATHQELQRLSRWVASYISFAARWHTGNFVPGDDLYVSKEDAVRFTHGTKIPRAPFIEVFEDIPNAGI